MLSCSYGGQKPEIKVSAGLHSLLLPGRTLPAPSSLRALGAPWLEAAASSLCPHCHMVSSLIFL